MAQCLLVVGSDISEQADAHCHGNGHSVFVQEGTEPCVLYVCYVFVCVGGGMCEPMELRVSFLFAYKDAVLLNAPNRPEQLLL